MLTTVTDGTITWTELDFNSKAGFTFRTTIKKATISEPGVYEWTASDDGGRRG